MFWEISLYVEDDNQGKLAMGSREKNSRLKSAQINHTFKRCAVLSPSRFHIRLKNETFKLLLLLLKLRARFSRAYVLDKGLKGGKARRLRKAAKSAECFHENSLNLLKIL